MQSHQDSQHACCNRASREQAVPKKQECGRRSKKCSQQRAFILDLEVLTETLSDEVVHCQTLDAFASICKYSASAPIPSVSSFRCSCVNVSSTRCVQHSTFEYGTERKKYVNCQDARCSGSGKDTIFDCEFSVKTPPPPIHGFRYICTLQIINNFFQDEKQAAELQKTGLSEQAAAVIQLGQAST